MTLGLAIGDRGVELKHVGQLGLTRLAGGEVVARVVGRRARQLAIGECVGPFEMNAVAGRRHGSPPISRISASLSFLRARIRRVPTVALAIFSSAAISSYERPSAWSS